MLPSLIPDLSSSFTGRVLAPDHPDFDAVARVYQLARTGRPAAIVRPRSAADVARAIERAREHGLEIAVRGGGHSAAGHSTGDGVLVIDMRDMRDLAVDRAHRLLRAGAGNDAGTVIDAAHEHGLTVPFGDSAAVGIAGIALGGGMGYLSRQHGLTVDHLVSAELVTADGRFVTASTEVEPELFWAIRGGGGNFGVVTSLEFAMVEAGMVYGGALLLPPTPDVLRAVTPLAGAAPRELGIIANVMPAPPAPFVPPEIVGQPVVVIVGCYNGGAEAGEAAWAPFRALARPIADVVGPLPYPALYRFTEAAAVPVVSVSRSMFVDVVDDTVVGTLREAYLASPGVRTVVQVRVLGGAVADVAGSATAYAHRKAPAHILAVATAATPEDAGPCRDWADEMLHQLRGRGVGAYANFLEDEGEVRVRDAYPNTTYRRLAAVKAAWDPDNVFHRNQNIRPAG
jgi:FAD/FMN-containing dehydrogenase